jgi:hypothetical protein
MTWTRYATGTLFCLLSVYRPAWGAEPIKFRMTAEHWKADGNFEFGRHDGLDSLALKPGDATKKLKTGFAVLNDFSFANGTIEFDVHPAWAMGTGIAFRRGEKNTDDYEYFYLRPQANCAEAVDCIQYAPQTHGVLLWDVFPRYQSPAPLREGEWNHVKLVVSGQRMNVFINGAKSGANSPTLKIGRLEGDNRAGGVVLTGPGVFTNFSITPDAVEGLSGEPERDPTADDSRYILNWKVAPFSSLPAGSSPSFADLPGPSAAWVDVAAERYGLVNVTRLYGLPVHQPERAVAWLKTTVQSGKNQTKKVSIGWSREIWVFVNGELVYSDKNLYQPPSARKTPDGRLSLENGSFELPLHSGANEVTVALADNFYGWGLIMHLDDAAGLELARK